MKRTLAMICLALFLSGCIGSVVIGDRPLQVRSADGSKVCEGILPLKKNYQVSAPLRCNDGSSAVFNAFMDTYQIFDSYVVFASGEKENLAFSKRGSILVATSTYLTIGASRPVSGAGTGSGECRSDSYYGATSCITGRPKTNYVRSYVRKDGTVVRGHYRS